MSTYFFLILALIIALVDWFAVAKKWKRLEYIAKPGVMLALLAWIWQVNRVYGGFQPPMLWFAAGIVFSMAGDIFLMLPREQFIAGLVSFLLAHIAYLIGFNTTPPPLNPASLVLFILVALTGLQLFRRISAGLKASGKSSLQIPVLVYAVAISLMLLSALITLLKPDWQTPEAILVSVGALLFFLSDTFLAWNKFIAPLPYGKLRVIITYHLGQILLILGAGLHFLK